MYDPNSRFVSPEVVVLHHEVGRGQEEGACESRFNFQVPSRSIDGWYRWQAYTTFHKVPSPCIEMICSGNCIMS
jgi:hypothetical protein